MKAQSEYFEKAVSWATDSQIVTLRSRRTAWIIAGVALCIVALQALAMAALVPLKTVQLITLLVDRQTGFVQAVDPNTPRRIAADDVLTQSFLAQYVSARESFDQATLPADYRKVALMSADNARTTYLASMPQSNPESPLRRFAPGTVIGVRIKSVSKLEGGMALVRFDTEQQSTQTGPTPAQPWLSLIRYAYSDAPLSFNDRLVNPLGFKVLSYRRTAEAAPPEGVQALPTSQPAPFRTPGVSARASPTTVVERVPSELPRENPLDSFDNVPMGSPLSRPGQ